MSHEPPVKKRQRIDVASASSSATSSPSTSSFSSTNSIDNLNEADQIVDPEWLEALMSRQCLCGVSVDPRKPFLRYIEAPQLAEKLDEWPSDHVLKYLSSLQLFLEIYLRQNRDGNICSKLVEIVNAVVTTQSGLNIVDDLLGLCDRRLQAGKEAEDTTRFVLQVAGKVISHYLVVVKDDVEQKWLKKVVDNLFVFDTLNDLSIRKINCSLDVISYIIEFKDMEEHPMEDVVYFDTLPLPPIETNYFAQVPSSGASSSERSIFGVAKKSNSVGSSSKSKPPSAPSTCHYVTLTDSDSFDTTHIKCVTIQILLNKWSALVDTIKTLLTRHQGNAFAQPCALTFLNLWEHIISVKTNLSVIDTHHFYTKLDLFEELLLTDPATLSPIICKQMLALFNEALCYGSTLALQDVLPKDTCDLAHQIIRHVKDYRILEHLPLHAVTTSSFGSNMTLLKYEPHSFLSSATPNIPGGFDRVFLQRITLLVLKSVAVSVKEIRSDSSDSSIDSVTDDTLSDMQMIERSIRNVLEKLAVFIRHRMEFHPESHFSKILIHLFSDQDDYLIEAMVCTLDVTTGISFRNNAFPELVALLNPVFTFLEFLKMISNDYSLLLDLLVSNETCFLLYLLRFLKYIRINWSMFVQSCQDPTVGGPNCLEETMGVLTELRKVISGLVAKRLFPYEIAPILRLLDSCESLYMGNELS